MRQVIVKAGGWQGSSSSCVTEMREMDTQLGRLAGAKQFAAYPSGRHSLAYIEDSAYPNAHALAVIEYAQKAFASMWLLRIASSSWPQC